MQGALLCKQFRTDLNRMPLQSSSQLTFECFLGGGPCSLISNKIFLVFPKGISLILVFLVPFNNVILFLCSQTR